MRCASGPQPFPLYYFQDLLIRWHSDETNEFILVFTSCSSQHLREPLRRLPESLIVKPPSRLRVFGLNRGRYRLGFTSSTFIIFLLLFLRILMRHGFEETLGRRPLEGEIAILVSDNPWDEELVAEFRTQWIRGVRVRARGFLQLGFGFRRGKCDVEFGGGGGERRGNHSPEVAAGEDEGGSGEMESWESGGCRRYRRHFAVVFVGGWNKISLSCIVGDKVLLIYTPLCILFVLIFLFLFRTFLKKLLFNYHLKLLIESKWMCIFEKIE